MTPGLPDAKIMASGDLDESKIADIVAAGAPIDAFGVGTELATSGDAPSMGTIYKLVEIRTNGETRYTAKNSPDKRTLPGAKQLFRFPDYDLLALQNECATGSEAMLKPLIIGGNLIEPLPAASEIRERAQSALTPWPTGAAIPNIRGGLRDSTKKSGRVSSPHDRLISISTPRTTSSFPAVRSTTREPSA